MIRLCKNLSYKPKYGSDTDSIMLKRLFSTVTITLVCLAAISFSAYAFFYHSVTSGSNTIKSSSFSTSVTIMENDTLVTRGDLQSYHFKPGEYTVTITRDSSANGTGFCMLHVGEKTYYTQQLGVDINAPAQERTEISFVLDMKVAATVAFESRWGTTSYYNSAAESNFYIQNTDPLTVITVDGTQGIADNPEDTAPEETTPEETPPKETTPEETIPEGTTPEVIVPTTDPAEIIHIVQPNESLASIAEKYGTTHLVLATYNELDNPSVIQPGQKIRIPTEQTE